MTHGRYGGDTENFRYQLLLLESLQSLLSTGVMIFPGEEAMEINRCAHRNGFSPVNF